MRKLAAFMALMMIVVACLNMAFAEEHNTAEAASGNSGDYEYAYLEDGTICITAYTGSSKKVTIYVGRTLHTNEMLIDGPFSIHKL